MDERTAKLYSQLKPYRHLVNKTAGFIRWALSKVDNPYLACSFGKDSAVMLHLILQERPDIQVRFIRWKHETEFIDNYDEVIGQWGSLNLEQIELTRKSLSDRRKDRYQVGSGYDSFFVGLRMEESVARRITLKKDGMFYKNKAGLVRIAPLADWKQRDIAAYVLSNNLPTLSSYQKHGLEARTASRIPREDFGIRSSFINDLKQRDLQAYQQLAKHFPEITSI